MYRYYCPCIWRSVLSSRLYIFWTMLFVPKNLKMVPISGSADWLAKRQHKTKCRRRSNLSRCQLHDCINRLGTPTSSHHSLNLAWPLFSFYFDLVWPSIFGQLLPLLASAPLNGWSWAIFAKFFLVFGIFMANRRSSRRIYALFTTNTREPEISDPLRGRGTAVSRWSSLLLKYFREEGMHLLHTRKCNNNKTDSFGHNLQTSMGPVLHIYLLYFLMFPRHPLST